MAEISVLFVDISVFPKTRKLGPRMCSSLRCFAVCGCCFVRIEGRVKKNDRLLLNPPPPGSINDYITHISKSSRSTLHLKRLSTDLTCVFIRRGEPFFETLSMNSAHRPRAGTRWNYFIGYWIIAANFTGSMTVARHVVIFVRSRGPSTLKYNQYLFNFSSDITTSS